jgi:1-acyl-sn-glycerol-3-phosphate acyltransferase
MQRSVPPGATAVTYTILWWLFNPILRLLGRVRVEGIDRIPRHGAVILCCNHRSWIDPVLVGALCPRRPVRFMAKEEIFRRPAFAAVLRAVGAFPVHRGRADRAALRRGLQILQAGGILGLFPEGTRSRSGQLGGGQAGAAWLALTGRAAVIPVAITGRYRPGDLRLRLGQPVDLSGHAAGHLRGAELQRVCDSVIMAAVGDLMADGEPLPTVDRRAAAR